MPDNLFPEEYENEEEYFEDEELSLIHISEPTRPY